MNIGGLHISQTSFRKRSKIIIWCCIFRQLRGAHNHDSRGTLLLINSSSLVPPPRLFSQTNQLIIWKDLTQTNPSDLFCCCSSSPLGWIERSNSIGARCSVAILSHQIDTWELNLAGPACPNRSHWEKFGFPVRSSPAIFAKTVWKLFLPTHLYP